MTPKVYYQQPMTSPDAASWLARVPVHSLAPSPSPLDDAPRLRAALGCRPRLLVKRDDALAFAFGGNKVRKIRYVLAEAQAAGADMLITCGGVQSNHARVTAAAAAVSGMGCLIVANGDPPERLTGNALLDALLGAQVRYVPRREDRQPAMNEAARELSARGRRPFVVPLGASTPRGALGLVGAVGELVEQLGGREAPDTIVHATSSGGTQAGLIAGCRLHGLATRVIGISADEAVGALSDRIWACRRGGSTGPAPRSTTPSWGTATACPPARRAKRRTWPRAPRRSSSITRTRPRRSPASSPTPAPAGSTGCGRCSSGTPAGRWGCLRRGLTLFGLGTRGSVLGQA